MGTALTKDIKRFLNEITKLALDYSYSPILGEKRILELHLTEKLHHKVNEWFIEEMPYTRSSTLIEERDSKDLSTYSYVNGVQFKIIISKDINKIYISNYEPWKENIQIKPTWKFHIESIEDILILIIINKIGL